MAQLILTIITFVTLLVTSPLWIHSFRDGILRRRIRHLESENIILRATMAGDVIEIDEHGKMHPKANYKAAVKGGGSHGE